VQQQDHVWRIRAQDGHGREDHDERAPRQGGSIEKSAGQGAGTMRSTKGGWRTGLVLANAPSGEQAMSSRARDGVRTAPNGQARQAGEQPAERESGGVTELGSSARHLRQRDRPAPPANRPSPKMAHFAARRHGWRRLVGVWVELCMDHAGVVRRRLKALALGGFGISDGQHQRRNPCSSGGEHAADQPFAETLPDQLPRAQNIGEIAPEVERH